ncbi:MAG: ADP-glyceromanno-heptose 6-epimerase [Gemmatimonadetes bacterium]|nr:ADP-glyceromanno-heptose 6-epimerase [Gemmatimonadota bacterium]
MIVVTGGAGFIGGHLIRALNDRGIHDILLVDDATCDRVSGREGPEAPEWRIAGQLGVEEFRARLRARGLDRSTSVVFHQGAVTDTTAQDEEWVFDRNYECARELLDAALDRGVRMVYASSAAVYGNARRCREASRSERPLSPYARSKLAFDQYVRARIGVHNAPVIGLRYFNVYGPGEERKGRMASMVSQTYWQLAATGVVELFEGSGGHDAGEQRRDFVHVDDVIRANLHFGFGPAVAGIFNLGTGVSRSFNEVAQEWIRVFSRGEVRYQPMPAHVRSQYQHETCADLGALRRAGYHGSFMSLHEGIDSYNLALTATGERR